MDSKSSLPKWSEAESSAGKGDSTIGVSDEEFERIQNDFIQTMYKRRVEEKNMSFTGELLIVLLDVLGIPFDLEDMHSMIDDWHEVGEDEILVVLNTMRITNGIEKEVVLDKMRELTITMGPFDYVFHRVYCGGRDASWEFRTILVSTDLSPRNVLFISTGVVLVITCALIILLMSLLWMAEAHDRENSQIMSFYQLLSSFVQSFEREFTAVQAEHMVSHIETLAAMMEPMYVDRQVLVEEELVREVQSLSTHLEHVSAGLAASFAAPVLGHMTVAWNAFKEDQGTSLLSRRDLNDLVGEWKFTFEDFTEWDVYSVSRERYLETNTSLWNDITTVNFESEKVDCAYGVCNYSDVSCLQNGLLLSGGGTSTDGGVYTLEGALDLHRQPAFSIAFTLGIGFNTTTVCATTPLDRLTRYKESVLADVVKNWNADYLDTTFNRREIILAKLSTNTSETRVTYVTPWLRMGSEDDCYNSQYDATCLGLDILMRDCLLSQTTIQRSDVMGYTHQSVMASCAPVGSSGLVISINILSAAFMQRERVRVIDILNSMNREDSDNAMEYILAGVDEETGTLNAQLSTMKFQGNCIYATEPCFRRPAATAAAEKCMTTKSSGWIMQQDYQPVPVIAAYAYMPSLQVALILEDSVTDIRGHTLTSIKTIIENNNKAYEGTLEAQLVRSYKMPTTRTFNPRDSCTHIRDCVKVDGIGAIIRSDCPDCSPIPSGITAGQVEYVSALRNQEECTECMDGIFAGSSDEVSHAAVSSRSTSPQSHMMTDYRNKKVIATSSFLQNFSCSLIVKVDKSDIDVPIRHNIGIAVGISIGIVMIGFGLLMAFSRHLLDKIEVEWKEYTHQIDAEKKKFDTMVRGVVPSVIKSKLDGLQKPSMVLHNAALIFVDTADMLENTRTWPAEMVSRYMTYYLTVLDRSASECHVHKIRIFGDCFFAIGGLSNNNAAAAVHSVASFGQMAIQLCGSKFAHFPQSVKLIRDNFADVVEKYGSAFPDVDGVVEDTGEVVMPQLKIGIHVGSVNCSMLETGRTPIFDVYGTPVALAARMQSTAVANQMHLTGTAKEKLESIDSAKVFEFDKPRKTLVKGQGIISSFFIISASIAVPSAVIEDLGIRYANVRVFYKEKQEQQQQQQQQDHNNAEHGSGDSTT